jgi:oleandomycin transport system permease protein
VNPVTRLADAVRDPLSGGPVAGPVVSSLVRAAAIAAVFFGPAMRAYRSRT